MTDTAIAPLAPELEIQEWLNTKTPLSLSVLRGKVVVIEAFQMLCPGCVSHSLPQAVKVSQAFSPHDVAVIGLHTVFEHHGAQGSREALSAFLHEYRIHFPVAIDAPSGTGTIPRTMAKYQMRGTPSLLLIDRDGRLRKHSFGRVDDLSLGAEIMALVTGAPALASETGAPDSAAMQCDENGCPVPAA